jgi:prevent-host-death family protein
MPGSKILERAVTSTEFQTRAGLYFDRAATEAVVITKYNRPSRVLLDYEEYSRLQALAMARPTRRAARVSELESSLVDAIEGADYGHIDPELDKLLG